MSANFNNNMSSSAVTPTVIITPPNISGTTARSQRTRRLSVPEGPLSPSSSTKPTVRRHSTAQAPSAYGLSVDSPRHGGPIAELRQQQQRRGSLTPLTEGPRNDRRTSVDNGRQQHPNRSRKQSSADSEAAAAATIRADEVIDALVKYADDTLINGNRDPLPSPSSDFAMAMRGMEGAEQRPRPAGNASGKCKDDSDLKQRDGGQGGILKENNSSERRRRGSVDFVIPSTRK